MVEGIAHRAADENAAARAMSDEIDIGPAKICATCVSFLHAEGQKAVLAHLRGNRSSLGVGDALDMMRPVDRKKLGLCAEERTKVVFPASTCGKWSARSEDDEEPAGSLADMPDSLVAALLDDDTE